MHNRQYMPAHAVRAEHMSKEASDVAKSVGLVAMNSIVILCKGLLEEVGPKTVELCKTLTNEAVEFRISAFLRTTFDDHGGQLRFLSGRESHLH